MTKQSTVRAVLSIGIDRGERQQGTEANLRRESVDIPSRMAKRTKPGTRKKPLAAPVATEVDGRSLSEMAYQAILEGLFTRKVPAGAYLSQNELVQMLGVPVQPLRDALRILETEGVLTI